MPSQRSRIDVWNGALDMIEEQPLSSDQDTSFSGRWLQRNYAQKRDYMLGRYYWKFARKRVVLAPDTVTPAWDWQYRYLLPADCIRIVPPTYDGSWNGTPIPYEEEEGYLLCDQPTSLRLRYVARIEEEGLWSNDFVAVMELYLALTMAHRMTGKQSFVERLKQDLTDTINEVKSVAAGQVAQEAYYDSDVLTSVFGAD
jgi:hypothetical protein